MSNDIHRHVMLGENTTRLAPLVAQLEAHVADGDARIGNIAQILAAPEYGAEHHTLRPFLNAKFRLDEMLEFDSLYAHVDDPARQLLVDNAKLAHLNQQRRNANRAYLRLFDDYMVALAEIGPKVAEAVAAENTRRAQAAQAAATGKAEWLTRLYDRYVEYVERVQRLVEICKRLGDAAAVLDEEAVLKVATQLQIVARLIEQHGELLRRPVVERSAPRVAQRPQMEPSERSWSMSS